MIYCQKCMEVEADFMIEDSEDVYFCGDCYAEVATGDRRSEDADE